MDKPKQQIIKYYDYREVKLYLERKGVSFDEFNSSLKCDDFWQWLVDVKDAGNGGIITLYPEEVNDEYDFVSKIITEIFKEFQEDGDVVNLINSW